MQIHKNLRGVARGIRYQPVTQDRIERPIRDAYVALGDAIGRTRFNRTQRRRIDEVASESVQTRPWGKLLDYLTTAADLATQDSSASLPDVLRVLDAMRGVVIARWRDRQPLPSLSVTVMREAREQAEADVAVMQAVTVRTLPHIEAALREVSEHESALAELRERLESERAALLTTGRPHPVTA